MFTLNGTGIVILLAVGYFGVNAIVKETKTGVKKAVDKIQKDLEERIGKIK